MRPTCSICGTEMVPIVYGYPPPVEAERRGECIVGGCLESGRAPEYACATCLRREAEDQVRKLRARWLKLNES